MSGATGQRHARRVALLRRAYDAFNRREVDTVLALLDPDVEWPNVLQGTTLRGRDDVRAYWLGQFETLDPCVKPEAFVPLGQNGVVVAVRQVIRDRDGNVRGDSRVAHAYTFRGELVARMAVSPTVKAAGSAPWPPRQSASPASAATAAAGRQHGRRRVAGPARSHEPSGAPGGHRRAAEA